MNQYLGVKSGKIQMRSKARCSKIMINYFLELSHEEVNPLSQAQVLDFWKKCFRQIQDVELR